MSSFVRWIRRSRSSSQPQRSRALVTASAAVALLITAGALVIGPHSLASAQSSTFDDYASSPGLAEDHADVFRLYWAFFDRKPEVDGAQYWVGRYNQCASLNDITWSFGNSTEFVKTYGALSDRDYITLVYSNVLDRTPDENGYQYWLGLLSNGTLTRSELMLYFSLGDEFRRQRPLPSDGVAYGGCTPPPTATTTTTSLNLCLNDHVHVHDIGSPGLLRQLHRGSGSRRGPAEAWRSWLPSQARQRRRRHRLRAQLSLG